MPLVRSLTPLILTIALAVAITPLRAEEDPAYKIETIPLPEGFDPDNGGIAFTPAGELVVVSRHSGILIGQPDEDPEKFTWRTFCDQILHQPNGVLVEQGGSLLVPQIPELTRLFDTDADGRADYFEAVTTAWGVSGNHRATNTGPVPDGEGNWFVALATASPDAGTFHHVRGEYSPAGRRGHHYSATPYNGWIIKVTPAGELIPWASGFRHCNGIGMNEYGELFATDSAGDWKSTTAIYRVQQGQFYGHPSSLVWDKDFAKHTPDPLQWALDNPQAADAKRSRPVVQLPTDSICTTAGEPLFDTTDGAFGPFPGQLLVGDTANHRILRVMLENVDGQYQGGATHFLDTPGLGSGNHRLAFGPDGNQLYVGQTRVEGKDPVEGIKRITWTGRTPFAVQNISLAVDGFELTFTSAVDRTLASDVTKFAAEHFTYEYSQKTDHQPADKEAITPARTIITPDGRGLTLQFNDKDLIAGRIYELDLTKIKSVEGRPLSHGPVCYSLNRLRPPTRGVIKFKPLLEPDKPDMEEEETGKPEPKTATKPAPKPKAKSEPKPEQKPAATEAPKEA